MDACNHLSRVPGNALILNPEASPRDLMALAGCYWECAREILTVIACSDDDDNLGANAKSVRLLAFAAYYLGDIALDVAVTAADRAEVAS